MPSSQGKYPPRSALLLGTVTGVDENGAPTTSNSQEYRGRPYSFANKYDQMAMDWTREHAKVSWQKGLRVLALYLTTSQNDIQ